MKISKIYLLILVTFSLLFFSCKDSSTGTTINEDDQIDLSKPLERLPGNENKPIEEAVFDFSIPTDATEDDISTIEVDGIEQRILRTEIEVGFKENTKVSQINELLQKYDIQIIDMIEGIGSIIFKIPDPGSISSLNSLMEEIENESIVELVVESTLFDKSDLLLSQERLVHKIPEHISSNSRLEHHLAIRAHAAWNMKSMVDDQSKKPWFVIADGFGDGIPGKGYNSTFKSDDFATGNPFFHGYHVLGVATGHHLKQNDLNSTLNDVVGIIPNSSAVRAYDMFSYDESSMPRRMNYIIRIIREVLKEDPDARIILNTSLNNRSRAISNNTLAYIWIGKVRGTGRTENLENKIVHFTAAGNHSLFDAQDNSFFSLAGLKDVRIKDLNTRSRLKNTFVVENRVNTPESQNQRPLPGCANFDNSMGGNLSAIGTDVYSFVSNSAADRFSGSSLSTPQAAGLAYYVWAVNPSLSVSEVMNIMQNTSEERSTTTLARPSFDCNNATPQPVIDAYAAILAAGGENARRVLLDVNKDNVFNEKDIEIFVREFNDRDGELDYSRYDLNGTGNTGGNGKDRFDLNFNLTYGIVTQNIEGEDIEFNESSLTDQEILCYYAYSELFEGNSDVRSELLDGVCSESACGPVTFTYNGTEVTYDSVIGANNRCWLDRNLGAYQVATSSTDIQAYGDLYQWGRGADGHEKRDSPLVSERRDFSSSDLSSSDQPGHGNFILSSRDYNHDWRNPKNDNLWQGVNGINNPCPDGYRLPTEAEWNAERQSWSSNNASGAFASPLKLTVAGERETSFGDFVSVGSAGNYWSSTVFGTAARRLGFTNSNAGISSRTRAYGLSVRCIMD